MSTAARLRSVASAIAVAALLLAAPGAEAQSGFEHNPVIFVHGFVGSGAQFESQKMRFMSNGYPESYVRVLEYDSTFGSESRSQVHARLDALIAQLKQETGKSHVDVLGHSLGTSVMQEYLNSSAARAANVSHYVNVDGQQADSPPGGVPTLAIWAGRGTPDRSIRGATNVTIPNQTHVQVATSAESFVEYYKFFTGSVPSQDIVPEDGPIAIEGRAMLFPQNRGLPGGITVEVWEVDGSTGQRTSSAPVERLAVDGSGAWGPVRVQPGRHYEFALLRPGVAMLHYYYEPFVRSDHLIRLLYSDAVEALVERGERHVSWLVLRYKELWGDQGPESDALTVNGTNVCNEATCPLSKQVNAVFVFDRRSDGRTDLSAPDPVFSRLPFITGVDVFAPAARPPTGTVSVGLTSRGAGPARTLNFPNFASTIEGSVLQFNDFDQPVPGTVSGTNAQQRLRVAVRPRRVRAGERRRFRLRVTVRQNGRARAVAGARVRLGGRAARTGRRGRARITTRFRKQGVRRVRATLRGYRAGKARIRVLRPRSAR
jgi:pimeloyl-ACP methyl ester carboxylesterase